MMSTSFNKILLGKINGTWNLMTGTRTPSTTTSRWLLEEIDNVENGNDELSNKDEYVPYVDRPETYIVPIVFLLILLVGVTGNGILVLTLLRHSNMRNVPNTYVLSLALGDLLVIITCVPFTSLLYTIESWPWGLAVCKISECAKDVSIGVSVFTLTALSAERYCAIVNPIRRHVASLSAKPLTILTASLIWLFAMVLAMPDALFSHVPTIDLGGNRTIFICSPFPEEFGQNYKKGMVLFKFLAYYAIPLCIIAGFYFGMARHLELSTRNMPGELSGAVAHRGEQIRARKKDGPNTREYLQLALERVLELQRTLNDNTYFIDETSDLGESDNDDDLMKHVVTKVFRDLPGTTSSKLAGIIERETRVKQELSKIRFKTVQLSGYDTCRKVAVHFMKKAVQSENPRRLPDSPMKLRRKSIGNADFIHDMDRKILAKKSDFELKLRMLTELDIHLATKQRDYTARLMRH
ncbi:neuropeptide CCHamide-1 receptor-like isoform X2 [Venturia canescens]|nr:neuropeptide CCHamide-1 receptor-like isoform X2 [Venturia canescens]XP_043279214.1 neuropeptide CCHamide-1 receptor-like isoform X2 [Venturia canescens]XP_043279216.1 neuropeptide CCHamide-1 receptor-like isoform X2 [Venturia canescens]XP_043279217.1 neuropeptide CCHamide-1 receptor-like isoform X2 [Venturia canescens]